jgi:hypothetical protein
MLTDRATAMGWIRDVAASRWDAALADHGGFTRAANALTYARKVSDGGRHRIHLDLIVRPPYARDSFYLYLRGSVAFPTVAQVSARMLGSRAGTMAKTGIVDLGLLELLAPDSPWFLFASAEQLEEFAPEIERYLVDAIVPYLDQRMTIAELTAAKLRDWAASGAAPGDVGPVAVFVAAGQLAMGDAPEALRTLETAYPAGTRARENRAEAFAVVGAALGEVG